MTTRLKNAATNIKELHELVVRCGYPNWDGDDALPVSAIAMLYAEELLRHAVSIWPHHEFKNLVDIAPGLAGDLEMCWQHGPKHLIININPNYPAEYLGIKIQDKIVMRSWTEGVLSGVRATGMDNAKYWVKWLLTAEALGK